MLLPGAIFALVTVGFVGPCLIDAARTPRYYFGRHSRGTWLAVIVAFWAFGALTWLLAGRPRRGWLTPLLPRRAGSPPGLRPAGGLGRHPPRRALQPSSGAPDPAADTAGRQAPVRPAGPDDDPEFLTERARRVRDARGASGRPARWQQLSPGPRT